MSEPTGLPRSGGVGQAPAELGRAAYSSARGRPVPAPRKTRLVYGMRDLRTPDQLRQHYEVERELADRLRVAPRDERRAAYTIVYDELFERVPLHPQLTRKDNAATSAANARRQMHLIGRFLKPSSTVLEIGPGDLAVTRLVAARAAVVYAVDVSETIVAGATVPSNVRVAISDGVSVPVPPDSIDIAYSNQLMEHLHPEDAEEQLLNIQAALKPGGLYVCVTPNRLSGPHDVSKYFDLEPHGLHLREYSIHDLRPLLKRSGFTDMRVLVGGYGHFVETAARPVEAVESLLNLLPRRPQMRIARLAPLRMMLGVRIVARKR